MTEDFHVPNIDPSAIEDPELGAILRERQAHLQADRYGKAAFDLLKEVLEIIQPHIGLLPEDAVEKIRDAISKVRTSL